MADLSYTGTWVDDAKPAKNEQQFRSIDQQLSNFYFGIFVRNAVRLVSIIIQVNLVHELVTNES